MRTCLLAIVGPLLIAAASLPAAAAPQSLSGSALIDALRRGGYVIVMRHASSPREEPDAATAEKDNVNHERQLDAAGRAAATAMGQGFRRLRIPVAEVLTSPTYRAMETARLAGWAAPRPMAELGDRGRNMQAVTETDGDALRKLASGDVRDGNRVVITHMPNIARAFPTAGDVADGEALVFAPARGAAPMLVGRIKIEEWPQLQ